MNRSTAARLAALTFAGLTTLVILVGIDGLARPDTAAPTLAHRTLTKPA